VPTLPFKLNQHHRHRIPKQTRKLTNSAAYDAALRQRGSLTVWFTDEAVATWKAAPRRLGRDREQRWYSPLAILTALTLRAVFRLALRQTEGLIGSIIHLLGLTLAVPDHSTLCRRAETLAVPCPRLRNDGGSIHLLVDSTGLKLCGAGEWLVEKHGTKTRRSWRKLHIGMDADTGQIVAAALTAKDVDDGSQVGPLLDQVAATVSSFTGDGAYDQEGVSAAVAERYPEAAIIVPPRSTAVPSEAAATEPTQRDRHLQRIAEHGRMAWQKASGYTKRARAEVVFTQMTKPDVFAVWAGGQHVSDLHVGVGDDHAVDKQQHELAALLEAGLGQSGLHALAERFQRRCDAGQLLLARGIAAQLFFLPGQRLHALFEVAPAPLVFVERDDGPEIGVGQPFELLA